MNRQARSAVIDQIEGALDVAPAESFKEIVRRRSTLYANVVPFTAVAR